MAIPVVETTAITDVTSNSTSQSVTLPSGVAEDDIILIIPLISLDKEFRFCSRAF